MRSGGPRGGALRRPAWALGVVLAAAVIMSGCVPTAANPFAPAGTNQTELTVWVENRGFNEFRLYALSSRGAQAMGVVGGNTQRTMKLPWRQLDQLSFRLEVLAGRSYTTHTVTASPGDRVEMVVPSNPAGTQLRVR